ncbi:MAG: FAD:protein FMN transferase [Alphaproteobacteria bacterium]|nr:FAD:protein FMN transferase [Alphaproteobacteria bacterium]
MKKHFIYIGILLGLGVALYILLKPVNDFIEFHGKTMGTTYYVKIASKHKDSALHGNIKELLENFNSQMSTWDKDSELSKLNSVKNSEWVDISEEVWRVLKLSKKISIETGGAFDISVGKLVNLWGFGADGKRRIEPPIPQEIEQVKNHIGMDKLELHQTLFKARKKDAKLYLDLSAIAKGYGVDLVSEYLLSKGYSNHIIEIGGELRVSGFRYPKKQWKIAVEVPDSSIRKNGRILELTNTGVATSGDYRNFFTYKGKRYSHTINPLTGKPVTHNLTSVTVFNKDCAVADAYATAFMVIGATKALELANKKHLKVVFYVKVNDKIEEKLSKAMEAFLELEMRCK